MCFLRKQLKRLKRENGISLSFFTKNIDAGKFFESLKVFSHVLVEIFPPPPTFKQIDTVYKEFKMARKTTSFRLLSLSKRSTMKGSRPLLRKSPEVRFKVAF